MTYFLGIDAGGTSTRAAVADEARVLGRAQAGSIKRMRVSAEEAEANLRSLLDELTRSGGIPITDVVSACVGIAGSTVSTVSEWVWQTLGPLLRGGLTVCGDVDIALDAAFPGEAGVLVIAGTGSNTLGRTTSGVRVGVGGWGPMLADDGSGYWIGQRALRLALREYDAAGASRLLSALMAAWQAETLDQLIEMAHATPAPDVAGLTRVVAQTAAAGEPLAQDVLRAAGQALGVDASLALRKLIALEPAVPRRVAFIGSVLANITMVREAMLAEVERQHPGTTVRPEPVDAVEGALWRARQSHRATA